MTAEEFFNTLLMVYPSLMNHVTIAQLYIFRERSTVYPAPLWKYMGIKSEPASRS
jgi:hypothetical protein